MCTLLYILLVNICIIISALSDPAIKELITKYEASPSPNITIDEYQKLHIILGGIDDKLVVNVSCNGSCLVGKEKATLTCRQERGSDQKFQLIVAITTNLTTKYDGNWKCHYFVTAEAPDQNGTNTQTVQMDHRFQLNVTPHPTPQLTGNWIYIGAGIGVLVILIIIGQTICIIYFKKKAIAAKREVRMCHDDTKHEDQTRYSLPPKKVEDAHEARESGIYEVLENIKGPPPPPPRNNGKESILERIKKRPLIPLPTDEVYEAVPDEEISPAPTPLPFKKEVKPKVPEKMEVKKKPIPKPKTRHETQETPAVSRKPLHSMGMPIPGIAGHGIGGVPNELKEALRQRQNTMSQKSGEPIPPKPVPKMTPKPTREPIPLSPKPWSEQPTVKMERPWTKESPQIKHKPWAQEAPIMAKEKQWPPKPKKEKWLPESPASQRSHIDRDNWQNSLKSRGHISNEDRVDGWQESMERKRTNVTVIPMNPGLPPANAPPAKLVTPWGETIPPKPNKHQMIRVRTEHCDSVDDEDDDEFEVYDDLESFHLYSI